MGSSVLFGVVLFFSGIGWVSANDDATCMQEWKKSPASKTHCYERNILSADRLYDDFKTIDGIADVELCYVSVSCRDNEAEYHPQKFFYYLDSVKSLRNDDGQLGGAAERDEFSSEAQARWKRERGVD